MKEDVEKNEAGRQYATAYAAAVALSRRVLAGGEAERESYLDILRSGCSRYPVETIALGGVDTASPACSVAERCAFPTQATLWRPRVVRKWF